MRKIVIAVALVATWVAGSSAQAGTCDPKAVVNGKRKVTAAQAHLNPKPSEKVTGTIAAGTEVDVVSSREVEGQTWYLVRWPEGGTKRAGWIQGAQLVCD